MRPVTKAEFARERHVSRTRVYQWLDDGRISALQDGRIDADEAHARLDASLDQTKGVRRDGNITSSQPRDRAAAQLELGSGDKGNEERAAAAAGDRTGEERSPGSGSASGGSDYWEHKTRRERAEAQLSELKALQAAGALTSAAGVRKEAAAVARQVRNAMLAIPDRIAPVLDPGNPARAHKLLTDEITKALLELRAELEQRGALAAGAHEREPALQ